MGAVSGAEGVVHVAVSQAGQLFAELGQVLGLLLAEAGVLQQNHVAVVHSGNSGLSLLAHNGVVIGEHNVLAQQLAQTHGYGSQAELLFGAVLGLAQMAAQDHLATVLDQLLDGGQGGNDAVIVGDHALLHGNVEIAAHQNALALNVQFLNGFFT